MMIARGVTFKWHDAGLSFAPADKRLLEALTITKKELTTDKRNWQRKVAYKQVVMLLDPANSIAFHKLIGMTHPGHDALDNLSQKTLVMLKKKTGIGSVEELAANWKMLLENPDEADDAQRKLYTTVQTSVTEYAVTYSGFLSRLLEVCVVNNIPFTVEDLRVAREGRDLPPPRLDLIGGFRFSQEELLKQALLIDKSGLIGAPTRYGKTTLMVNYAKAYPTVPTVVVAPGVDLCRQLYDDFTGPRGVGDREVKLLCTGSKDKEMSYDGITVCSADSVTKLDPGVARLVLADEPHSLVTDRRVAAINKAFPLARRIGFGATLSGRFDGADPLIEGLFGPVLSERTYLEAVAEGAICPLAVIFIDRWLNTPYANRDRAYKQLLFENQHMANLAAQLCHEVIPEDFQTMLFIKNEKQADLYRRAIGMDSTIAMAKRMTNDERERVTNLMRENVIKRCLCTDIYVQGVTFSDVRVLINCEAGGNNTTAIQKPGRLAEIRPGKKCGIVFDFFFKDANGSLDKASCLVRDSFNRQLAYTEKGYEVIHVNTVEEAKQRFNELVENGKFSE